ncbi:MAG: Asp23/Gls24 family envelope stress response protein [Oscillospiraceae bacterium]|nr:Asp23/Gls24 family envelope stress response protein [Oscillospiraceae bacterium]MBP1567805.1 Asp23/Gls24 family envelope stress response protein [Oscillospiraceae bacterium]MBP1592368.1 Asp23/Gls24 family envelope stress response protein [Oscillospiraceae bacterium]MBQ5336956.1 Asp23/Gls24 family envelope stress response protein [Oscillospiraceae bacterium]MBR3023676.1 Asp23/Gls24 family envelope stress response protein [Oscillospiraceae bacterium]
MSKENTGAVRISEDVITSIAANAINEIKGVENIRSDYGLIRSFFVKTSPVSVKADGDVVEISADVVLKQGYSAVLTSEKIQNAVKSEVQSATGITVSRVNVNVSGISFEKK